MFNEFEVVCPNCDAILRLSSDWYSNLIEEYETYNNYCYDYGFPCVECQKKLILKIKVNVQ